jgi:pyruvate dehydrogenase E2 component (dihydrolipoamide acetyltransferase)
MELTLPLLGDVMTEGTVAKWLQADGASVAEGDPLYEVETDKVTLTVDAPASGTLQRVVMEGETVPVGTVVGRLAATAREVDAPAASAVSAAAARAVTPVVAPARRGSADVRATPAARAAARRLGVDLRRIANGGRVREADVLAAAAPTRERTQFAGRRKAIADRMRASLAGSAQLTVSMEADMTEASRLREQLKQLLPEVQRPTITDLVIRATVLALREHPALNATLRDGQLEVQSSVHMGIAVDADDGLIVPVVRNAQTLQLPELAEKTKAVSERARANRLEVEDVQGGTFTVTSLGPLGVDFFTPILNPPEVAILGIGRLFTKLALVQGRVEERQAMYLNLTFDHQAVDGAPAARFLRSVKEVLELPAALLIGNDA